MLLVIGDFNVRSSIWWSDDIDTVERTRLESITSYYGLYQIINKPTHILRSSSSCFDLIFTNQPNLVINSGVHPLLHQNCHYQIVFAQINLKVYYPPPYKRLVWDYKNANIDAIILAIKSFNWKNAFNGKDINSQVEFFNETLMNIFSNFKNSMAAGTFVTQWKRANIVPVHKKNDKQIASNYRPVSLLPICSKLFEKLLFNELFKIFEDKNLLSKHQSCFRLGVSLKVL